MAPPHHIKETAHLVPTTNLARSANCNVFFVPHRGVQQFVFIRQPQASSIGSDILNTLSVPLDHFQSYKYVIPIFTAPYIQADIYSVPQGNLPERQPGQEFHPVGKLKLWFMEAGGVAFKDAVGKAKEMWQQRREAQLDDDALRKFKQGRRRVEGGWLTVDACFTCVS